MLKNIIIKVLPERKAPPSAQECKFYKTYTELRPSESTRIIYDLTAEA